MEREGKEGGEEGKEARVAERNGGDRKMGTGGMKEKGREEARKSERVKLRRGGDAGKQRRVRENG